MNRAEALHPHPVTSAAAGTTKPLSRRRGFGLSAAAAILVLIAIVYGSLWMVASLHLRNGVLEWVAARQAEGYRISFAGLDLGGFPLAARVTILDPVVTAPDGRTFFWSWAGDRAAIEASPFRFDGITLRLAGEEALSINVGGKLKTYRGGADEITLQTSAGLAPSSGGLTVRGLALTADEPGDAIRLERLSASSALSRQTAPSGPEALLAVRIDALGLQLPQQLDLPLGNTLDEVAVDATIRGLMHPFANLRDGLERWRDGGGMVDFARLGFNYGPLTLSSVGTLSLDDAAQPVGTFTARILGFQQTIDALADRGIIDGRVAGKARMALALLSRKPPGANAPMLQVPLTLRERTLSVGPLSLLVVPEIEWPRGPNSQGGALPAFRPKVSG
ncbi:MAG: DUF2125 domain-containing protein [Rhodospirillales bacterium]|nr:DUF2125 domain-containing protein [Rhodospirillales bacterium]